ncbi:SIMPL domain-containing protein [soil metagenome]
MMTRILLFSLILMAGLPLPSHADDQNLGTPHITVGGIAITEVTPDQLNWILEVKYIDLDLTKAAEQHTQRVATVLEIIKKAGVPTKEIQTARMEFGENEVYRNGSNIKEGYFANAIITFKLSDLSKYNELWLAFSGQGNLSVKSVSYEHSKRLEFEAETRKKALLNAKEKATAMANTLGAKIGETLSIIENLNVEFVASYGGAPDLMPRAISRDAISPGTMPIRIAVDVTFRLINGDK